MTQENGRAFNQWLRTQLRVKQMSQRQLAMHAGVDHSTISRLIRGDRTPSLGTATKLARGLREIPDEGDATRYFGAVAERAANPVAGVEYALRADEYLNEAQVRRVMEYYLAVRMGWQTIGRSSATVVRPVRAPTGEGRPAGNGPAGGPAVGRQVQVRRPAMARPLNTMMRRAGERAS